MKKGVPEVDHCVSSKLVTLILLKLSISYSRVKQLQFGP